MNVKERTAAILKLLVDGQRPFTTAGELAENLGVSAKTISRELPGVAGALEKYGLALNKKKGAGFAIAGAEDAIASLKESLGQVNDHNYTPQERQSIIVSRLLPSHEPVKLFALSSLLGVTDSTISNDLDKLEGWFKGHGLKLVRKPGLGVYVEGEEQSIRQSIVAYIYDNIEENELLELVHANLADEQEKVNQAAGYLLDLVDKEIIHRLERLIRQAEKELETRLSDQAFIGLTVHLALAVQRIRKQERIHIRPGFLAELKQKQEFQTAGHIAAEIAKEFELPITEDEIGYITMHLLGARSRYRDNEATDAVLDNFHLVRLAKAIMKAAEEETGVSLYRNSELLTGLVNHLGPSISRLQMQMDIRNPLLDEMKAKFPELMQLAKKSVREVEKELELAFPESEIAFIAMHLSAALTDSNMLKKLEHTVIVACPTGMGTSRLLASRLRQQYDNLVIADQVSTLQLTPEYFSSHEAEFIVATVPIPHVPLPVAVVSALLTKEDQLCIDELLGQCEEARVEARAAGKAQAKPDFAAALRIMQAYDTAILSLLDNFFFYEDGASMTVQEVAEGVGRLVGSDDRQAEGIKRALLSREDQGSTAITGSSMILLHCRSSVVTRLQFGIVHLGSWFLYPAEPTEKIRTAIVMLAPAAGSCYELETIGHISAILLERWGLIEVLHEGDQKLIKEELTHIFREFHAKKYRELLGG
ncbi:transcriptional antiterminator, BglG family [Selenomonas ruminantium]|uniref:Transcriptional antiterminator, BglG family n=1 Tax=Selenomonas ruminantium TaxID=971 RepID=A0A1I3FUL1_SELRU|nr:PRD domain-containing protein [Selenomonas ruminantium]SFI14889.1 transcriptional antiterminator, BglG family [Selenomonas ruminantium]